MWCSKAHKNWDGLKPVKSLDIYQQNCWDFEDLHGFTIANLPKSACKKWTKFFAGERSDIPIAKDNS